MKENIEDKYRSVFFTKQQEIMDILLDVPEELDPELFSRDVLAFVVANYIHSTSEVLTKQNPQMDFEAVRHQIAKELYNKSIQYVEALDPEPVASSSSKKSCNIL